MRSTQRTGRLIATIGALALLAAACSDDSSTVANQFGNDSPDAADAVLGIGDEPPADDSLFGDTPAGVDRGAELAGRWEITDYTLGSGPITNAVGLTRPHR